VTYHHDQLENQIITSDKKLQDEFGATINKNAAIMRSSYDDTQLKKMSFDAIIGNLKNDLPTCHICFELFSDQFKETQAGVETQIIPCNHVFCSTCLASPSIINCPLCRGTITSTIPPKPSSIARTARDIQLAERSDGGY
jgi:hypothetical protein